MASAGADVVCAHFGLTSGGVLGAKHVLSLERARRTADEIFEAAAEVSPGILRLVYGGPVTTPQDAQYMYRGSTCQGYIGGSASSASPSRAPSWRSRAASNRAPASSRAPSSSAILFSDPRNYDYIEFVREYIAENYMGELSLTELAQTAHLSVSTSPRSSGARSPRFREYLLATRMEKARELCRLRRAAASSRSRSSSATETTPNSARCTKNTTAFHRARIRKAQKNTSSRAEAPKKR